MDNKRLLGNCGQQRRGRKPGKRCTELIGVDADQTATGVGNEVVTAGVRNREPLA